ncbi:hypothetical protein [Dyadobacter sp. NIV53]|uniref:hypothetical protein n=1 Tax=Dyadobacter sp. NIV53 TaxID=2861765 RepID=UPI001C870AF7|nr:hypothetical protein [Dyadobacter sp. NIV53]
MSSTLAHYAFIPWLKEGINAQIEEMDAKGAPAATLSKERASLAVAINLETSDIADGEVINVPVPPKTIKILGPPDVLSVSENAIVRTEPKTNVNNYESNGLPYIEFYKESFLWTYTPASAGTGAQTGILAPWLALICLKKDEFELKQTSAGRSFITIDSAKITNVFHDEKQHWAWGHVQLSTELEATTLPDKINEAKSELNANPDSGVCRLLCPRKLIRETHYTAFLIPTFETGRLAGLGLPFTDVLAQKISWGKTENYAAKTRGFDYPVYYQWSFQTGLYGDFESLARILKAVVIGPELGKRPMYIADAGYGTASTPPDSPVLGLEGALKPPKFVSDVFPNGTKDTAYREHLRKLLNLSIDNEKRQTNVPAIVSDSLVANPFYSATLGADPVVTPPVYGRWHAMVKRLQLPGENPPWVNTLNLDPRNRAAAGLGTTIIQKNQEDYMRRAWKQVNEVNKANEKIRRGALSKMVSNAIYRKHIRFASEDQSVRLTAPMHTYLLDAGETASFSISKSLIPNASQSAAFKKITRPGKKSIRKINEVGTNPSTLINKQVTQRFNAAAIATANPKTAPVLAVDTGQVGSAIATSVSNFQANDTAMAQQALFDIILKETDFTHLEVQAKKDELKVKIDAYAGLNATANLLAKNVIDGIASSVPGNPTDNTANTVIIADAPFKAVFSDEITAKTYENLVLARNTNGAPLEMSRATLLSDITTYGETFGSFNTDLLATMVAIPVLPTLDKLPQLSTKITKSVVPNQLIVNRITSSIILNVFNPVTKIYEEKELEDLRPIMAYPKFDDPMFSNLQALSQEYILPNIDKVPENSITLMETNQVFIEAFMTGLNHEMSKELLWREYPTDQRGTYFRQFWDITDNIRETDQEKKYDIKKIHTWTENLGDHSPRIKTSADDSPYLVLLIRGDLLKKYPNTQVYAQKAEFKDPVNPAAPRKLSDSNVADNILLPVFMATLDPDIYLFGFDLDKDVAKGDSHDATKPGWYFALRERPGQIRFGLDDWTPTDPDDPAFPTSDPKNWNDLSWEHLVTQQSDLLNYQVDVSHAFDATSGSENLPLAVWGKNAADMAYILYQNPVLFARHAQEMLPDD